MGLFKCPFCSSKTTRVTETRYGTPLVRFRRCPKCGKRFKTVESALQRDSEDYLNFVSQVSADLLIRRVTEILQSTKSQRVLIEQLRKAAGVKRGMTVKATELFT